jgi:hypothetical protein
MSKYQVDISAKDAGYSSTIKQVNASTRSMDDAVKSTASSITGSFGSMVKAGIGFATGLGAIKLAASAVRGVMDGFGDALDLGGKLNDLASRTGETAGNLMVLQRAFENSGVSADKVGTSVNKMQKFLDDASQGAKSNTETMGRLGVSFDDLKGKTPSEQMAMLAQKISLIEDPSERSALAIKVFGKAGGEMLPLLNNFSGEIETATGQLGAMPGIMDRANVAFDTISDNLAVAKNKVMEFSAGMLEKAAPALASFTTMLAGVDAAGWGQKLGEMVVKVADMLLGAFKSPQTAIDAIKLSLEAGIKSAGNLLMNSFINAGRFLREFFSSEMPGLLVDRLGLNLKIAFNSGLQLFTDGLLKVVRFFDADFGKSVSGIMNFFKDSFATIFKAMASDFVQVFTNPLAFIAGKIGGALKDSFGESGVTFKSALTDGVGTTLEKLSSGMKKTGEEYSQELKGSTAQIGTEWDKITSNIELSAKDFFGAEEAGKRAADKIKEIEEVGENFRNSFSQGTGKAVEDTQKLVALDEDRRKNQDAYRQTLATIKQIEEDIATAKNFGDKATADRLQKELAYQKEIAKALEEGKTMEEAIKIAAEKRAAAEESVLNTLGSQTAEMQKQLSISQEMLDSINRRKEEEKLDPGGRMRDKFAKEEAAGNISGMERVQRQAADREDKERTSQMFKDFERQQRVEQYKGEGMSEEEANKKAEKEERTAKKSAQDMAKELGIDASGKTGKQLREEIKKELENKKKEQDPTKKGEKEPTKEEKKQEQQQDTLQGIVQKIHDLCAKIEPKLPQTALGY